MKPHRFIEFAALAMLFVGCVPIEPKSDASSASNLFPSYTFLTIPVSDLPIGAQWIAKDIGTSGKGLAGDKVKVQRSYSSATISSDKSIKVKLDAIIFAGLGLGFDAGGSNSAHVVYNNIEVVSVADVSTMNIATNAKYIFRGIRIRDFTIYGNRETLAMVDLRFSNASGTYGAEVTPLKDARRVSLGGEGLYVAYQLISFEKLEGEKIYNSLLNAQVDTAKYQIADQYEIEVDTDDVWSCIVRAESAREKPWIYDDWHWKNDTNDEEVIAYLIHESCVGALYRFSVRNKNVFSRIALPETKFDIPFSIPWGADTKEDPVVGVYIENRQLIVDSIRIRSLRYENHAKTDKANSTYSAGTRLQGKVFLLREKYSMAIE